jgi:hypothetical protein
MLGAVRSAAVPALLSSSIDPRPSRMACNNPEATLVRRVVSDCGRVAQTSSSTAKGRRRFAVKHVVLLPSRILADTVPHPAARRV